MVQATICCWYMGSLKIALSFVIGTLPVGCVATPSDLGEDYVVVVVGSMREQLERRLGESLPSLLTAHKRVVSSLKANGRLHIAAWPSAVMLIPDEVGPAWDVARAFESRFYYVFVFGLTAALYFFGCFFVECQASSS